jgi:hypothetical protein
MNRCVAILRTKANTQCTNNAKNGIYCGIHKKFNIPVPTVPTVPTIQINQIDNIIENLTNNMIQLNLNLNSNQIDLIQEIYIVQLPEHFRCNENIYKVGMTRRGAINRLKGYPKNTKLLFSINVRDAKLCEREVMKKCKTTEGIINCNRNHSDLNKKLGNEYFESDFILLKNVVKETCDNFNKNYLSTNSVINDNTMDNKNENENEKKKTEQTEQKEDNFIIKIKFDTKKENLIYNSDGITYDIIDRF